MTARVLLMALVALALFACASPTAAAAEPKTGCVLERRVVVPDDSGRVLIVRAYCAVCPDTTTKAP